MSLPAISEPILALKNRFEIQGLISGQVTDLSDEASWGDSIPQEEIVWAPGKNSTQVAIALQRTIQQLGSAMAARVQPQVDFLLSPL